MMLNTDQLIRDVGGKKTVNCTVHVHIHILENYRLTKCSFMPTLLLDCHLFPQTMKVLELKEKLECSSNIRTDTCFFSASICKYAVLRCARSSARGRQEMSFGKNHSNPTQLMISCIRQPQHYRYHKKCHLIKHFCTGPRSLIHSLSGKTSGGTCMWITVLTVLSLPTGVPWSNLCRD